MRLLMRASEPIFKVNASACASRLLLASSNSSLPVASKLLPQLGQRMDGVRPVIHCTGEPQFGQLSAWRVPLSRPALSATCSLLRVLPSCKSASCTPRPTNTSGGEEA